jgi:CubicO group peptidase (beta-lactamase class C family)
MHISFKRLLLVGIFCIALSFQGCSPATGKTTPDEFAQAIAAFSEYVESRMAQDRIPGLTIGFLKDGFSWAQGYGFADLENRVPAGPDSAYRLASVSKTFTALAVLQLVEQGKIDLEAEVQAYVPDFPRKEWPVTVRLLLGHLGGISHYRNYDLESHIKEPRDTREALAIFQDFELVAEPGTKYHYSSYGFNLLAAVVEAASGQPFGRYLRDRGRGNALHHPGPAEIRRGALRRQDA